MNTIGVNIIANKTFANRSEELLTRKSQYIHELLTELSTLANEHCGKLKRQSDRQKIIRQYESLTRALITGYRTGVAGSTPPSPSTTIEDCEQTVKYLCAPYCTLGYSTACRQIDMLLEKGWHRSQTNNPPPQAPDEPG
jgi:hypothetical protein